MLAFTFIFDAALFPLALATPAPLGKEAFHPATTTTAKKAAKTPTQLEAGTPTSRTFQGQEGNWTTELRARIATLHENTSRVLRRFPATGASVHHSGTNIP